MRYLLPATLVAALALPGPALAAKPEHNPKRADAHVSLHLSSHNLIAGNRLVVRGHVAPGGPHRVRVVVRGRAGGISGTRTERDGSYRIAFQLPTTGIYQVRAFGLHDRAVTGSTSSRRRFAVYRRAAASYYGPGFYGGALACGGTLQPGTLGVAHKSLPCGTKVRLRYRGRSLTVPVVDRGPYVGGRDFDLTEATKQRLGFPDLGVVLSSR